jgi:hypothetical protein
MRERRLEVEHPDYATTLNDLGTVYGYEGEYELADRFCSPLLPSARKHSDETTPTSPKL